MTGVQTCALPISSGADGVLIVDDQVPDFWPKLTRAMADQGDTGVDFVVNTHWHFDHADGNDTLGQRDDTWIVSHANSREMMQRDNVINLVGAALAQPAYADHALPDITFDTTMQFHLNGDRIDLLHTGPAHTTGDAAVVFHGSNIVHLGDVYNNAGYPFIDAGNGGSLDGVITLCEAVLEMINEDTTVVPGHGPIASQAELVDYVSMLKEVRAGMLALIREGKTLEQILAAGLTAAWDEKRGNPTQFVNRSYVSLTTRYVP